MSQEEAGALATEEASAEEVLEEAQEEQQGEESEEEASSDETSEEAEELSEEQAEELADEVEQAIDDGATKEEVQDLVEKFKIKVNGKEKEVELDWNNKEDIVRRLQLAEAAQEAMHSRAQTEKVFEQEVNRLKSDPWEVLTELGLDPDELAEARIAKQIEELQKTPEQRAQEERDKELQDLREKLKKQEEEKERLELEKQQKQAEVNLEKEITEAISATSDLPKSAAIVRRIADTMAWAMDNGMPDVTAKEAVSVVEKEYNREINEILENMPDKTLETFISKKVTERFRKQRLAKIPTKKKVVDTGKKQKEEPRKKLSLRDFAKKGFQDK